METVKISVVARGEEEGGREGGMDRQSINVQGNKTILYDNTGLKPQNTTKRELYGERWTLDNNDDQVHQL